MVKSRSYGLDLKVESSGTSLPSQCCAFIELGHIRPTITTYNVPSCHADCARFIDWVLACRNTDETLQRAVKSSCPMAKCTFSCHPDDIEFRRHLVFCPFLDDGEYKCPYHKGEIEKFMISEPKKTWCRAQELKDAFRSICTRALYKAFRHRHKPNYGLGITGFGINASNNSLSLQPEYQSSYHCSSKAKIQQKNRKHPLSENNDSSPLFEKDAHPNSRRSSFGIKRSRIDERGRFDPRVQSQVREVENTVRLAELPSGSSLDNLFRFRDTSTIHELQGNSRSRLPVRGPLSVVEQHNFPTDDLNQPIVPQSLEEIEQALDLACVDLITGNDSRTTFKLEDNLQPESSTRGQQSIGGRLRSKSPALKRINTDVGQQRPVSISSTHNIPQELHQSTVDDPEILAYHPNALIEEFIKILHKTVQNTINILEMSSPLDFSNRIISYQPTAAEVFSYGWKAVKMILEGQTLIDHWSLVFLSQLAITCVQVVSGNRFKGQLEELFSDLQIWATAIQNTTERQYYLRFLSLISGRTEYKECTDLGTDKPLYVQLQQGPVIRICIQFLNTFEFLGYRNIDNHEINTLQLSEYPPGYVDTLIHWVIQPLSNQKMFQALLPAIECVLERLQLRPYMSIRDIELSLICRSRYHTEDHTLSLRFQEAVIQLCSDASMHLMREPVRPESYLFLDIDALQNLGKSLLPRTMRGSVPSCGSSRVQESSEQTSPSVTIRTSRVGRQRSSKVVDLHSQWAYHSGKQVLENSILAEGLSESPMTTGGNLQPFWSIASAGSFATTSSTRCSTSRTEPTMQQTPNTATSYHQQWDPVMIDDSTLSCYMRWEEPSLDSPNGLGFLDALPPEQLLFGVGGSAEYKNVGQPLGSQHGTGQAIDDLNNDHLVDHNSMSHMNDTNVVDLDLGIVTSFPVTPRDKPLPPEPEPSFTSCMWEGCNMKFKGKATSQRSNSQRHVKEAHLGVRLSICQMCSKSFGRASNLKAHERSVHGLKH